MARPKIHFAPNDMKWQDNQYGTEIHIPFLKTVRIWPIWWLLELREWCRSLRRKKERRARFWSGQAGTRQFERQRWPRDPEFKCQIQLFHVFVLTWAYIHTCPNVSDSSSIHAKGRIMSLNPSAFLIPSTAVTSRLIWDLIEARIVVPKFCKTFHERCCSRCNIIHVSFFHQNWLDFVMSKNLVKEWLISKSEFLYPYLPAECRCNSGVFPDLVWDRALI